jgi:mycothiol synthase
MNDTGHVWRPLRHDDLAGLARLEQICSRVDGATHLYGERGWASKLGNAADLTRDGIVTTDGNGEPLAFALVTYELRPGEAHGYLEGVVTPALRGQGIGRALLAWSEARAGAHLARIADGRRKVVRALFYDRGPDARALYERFGLRLRFAEHELRLPLDGALPSAAPRAGFSIESYHREAEPALYQVYRGSFGTRTTNLWDFATWNYQVSDGAGCGDFHPELSYLVRHDGDPVAYLMSQDASEPGGLFVQHLAVLPAFRNLGLAAALLAHTTARARDAGFAASVLTVDADNEAALGLYRKLGYQRVSCLTAYRKDLA